jgi:hypothetical protein
MDGKKDASQASIASSSTLCESSKPSLSFIALREIELASKEQLRGHGVCCNLTLIKRFLEGETHKEIPDPSGRLGQLAASDEFDYSNRHPGVSVPENTAEEKERAVSVAKARLANIQ